jgi:hypothetical protein
VLTPPGVDVVGVAVVDGEVAGGTVVGPVVTTVVDGDSVVGGAVVGVVVGGGGGVVVEPPVAPAASGPAGYADPTATPTMLAIADGIAAPALAPIGWR